LESPLLSLFRRLHLVKNVIVKCVLSLKNNYQDSFYCVRKESVFNFTLTVNMDLVK